MAYQHSEPDCHTGPGERYLEDQGYAHVAAWKWRRGLAAMDAANKVLADAIARGEFSRPPRIEERAP
jgi:hypothetical protein